MFWAVVGMGCWEGNWARGALGTGRGALGRALGTGLWLLGTGKDNGKGTGHWERAWSWGTDHGSGNGVVGMAVVTGHWEWHLGHWEWGTGNGALVAGLGAWGMEAWEQQWEGHWEWHWEWDGGNWALGMGQWEWDTGYWSEGTGHWEWDCEMVLGTGKPPTGSKLLVAPCGG